VASVTQPTNGASIVATGSDIGKVRYTPNPNFFGSDSFTYTISDSNAGTATATVTITVTAVKDAPVATSQSVTA
jgi:hypothetical protein